MAGETPFGKVGIYCNWPDPLTTVDKVASVFELELANSLEYLERIQRGLEWTQFLKRLSACSLFDCLSANFLNFSTIKYYSAVQYSMVT